MTGEERKVKLAEYAAAQSSAEHLDTVSWTIKGVLWGGTMVLLGFVIERLADAGSLVVATRGVLTGAAGLGILALVAAYLWSRQC